MAYAKDIFDFLNKSVKHIHNKSSLKIRCRATNNKAYRAMQSRYANCMVKAKTLHVNVEEKRRVQLSHNF